MVGSIEVKDAAYAAGVVDSDGWFTCGHSKGTRKNGQPWNQWYFRCGVKQIDSQVVYWLKEMFGGYVHFRHDPHNSLSQRPVYTWTLSGKLLVKFIQHIQPFMKIKQDRAQVILDFYSGFTPIYPKTGGVFHHEVSRRKQLHARLKFLNSRH